MVALGVGELIPSAVDFEQSSFSVWLSGRMAIRWLAVLCVLAFLAQYSLSFPEEKLLEEFELDEPEGIIVFLLILL